MTAPCLLCGHVERTPMPRVVNAVARHNTPQTSVACARCAFVQADPLPDEDTLSEYYRRGQYRRDFPPLPVLGVEPDAEGYEAACVEDAAAVADVLMHPEVVGITPGERVLEVGCGYGRAAAALAGRGVDVSAWDDDPAMRAEATKRGVRVSVPTPGVSCVYALQVLEHCRDPLATLVQWRSLLADGGRVHVQVPTIERMYGGAEHFFQWPHVVNFTSRTLWLMLLRAGFRPVVVGCSQTSLVATAIKAHEPCGYEESLAMFGDRLPVDDVPALIAAHEVGRPKESMVDAFVSGAALARLLDPTGACDEELIPLAAAEAKWDREEALREEVSRLRDRHGAALDFLALLAKQYEAEAVRVGEQWQADPWLWGYLCGQSRTLGAVAVQLGTVANGLVMRGRPT